MSAFGSVETPCTEGGIKHGGPGCEHGEFHVEKVVSPNKVIGTFTGKKKKVLTRPCPPDCDIKAQDHIHVEVPGYASRHATGCPCWTCKGVPDKPKKKKPEPKKP